LKSVVCSCRLPFRTACWFVSYFYGDRPDPHSFPTRRSSDLPFSRSYGVILPSSLTRVVPLTLGFSPRLPVSVCGTGTCTANRHRDRKSTRLNSSHVSISYAVFCLKKNRNELIKFPLCDEDDQ